MSSKEIFHISVQGFGHIAKGKPCQDYALSSNKDGCQVLVVCDGHGGTAYVRSDVGARIAAENTKQILLDFAKDNPLDIFDGISMAVTAMPQKNPFIDIDGNRVRYEDLDETQQIVARQAKEYIKATEEYQDAQDVIKGLIKAIIDKWIDDIEEHARTHKFTKEEKKSLPNGDIRKAYGCTVLAFLMTHNYWLALQIGDGKIVICNDTGEWNEPVPKDCECFLNRTTSLCDRMPEKEFRYALNGAGKLPVGVFLSSDGVDGSFARKDDLYDFYIQVMDIIKDPAADIKVELEDFLPQLSEKGSHDDVSIAGLVNTEWMVANEDLWTILAQEKKLYKERTDWKDLIRALESKTESLSIRLNKVFENLRQKKTEFDKWCNSFEAEKQIKAQDILALQQDTNKLQEEYNKVERELTEKRNEFREWVLMTKIDLGKIEERKNALLGGGTKEKQEDINNNPAEEHVKPSAESIWE